MLRHLLKNFRRGFATNSSSSHSLVYYKEPIISESTAVTVDPEFGWNHFVLSSLGDKLMYALVAYVSNIGAGSFWQKPAQSSVDEAYEQYGHLFPEFGKEEFEIALQGYIDHESVESPDRLLALARDPHVEIHGGNDNGGYNVYDAVLDAGVAAEYGQSLGWGEGQKITYEDAKNDGGNRWY